MIQGFIDGIFKMINNVKEAAMGIANKIKSFLHFSRPDEGPLRNYEEWMPDMVKGLTKKLNESAPQLYNASKELAQKVAKGLDISSMLDNTEYLINTDFVKDIPNVSAQISSNNEQPQNIMEETFEKVIARYDGKNEKPMHMTIQYLGKTIFDDTIEYINSKTRRTGRNTIVMVGD